MAGRDPLGEELDGACGDLAVSGDAMRWSPRLADEPPREGGSLTGVDVAVGLGATLGLDAPTLRRLVTGALFALPAPPADPPPGSLPAVPAHPAGSWLTPGGEPGAPGTS
jgi:hypothetical protein